MCIRSCSGRLYRFSTLPLAVSESTVSYPIVSLFLLFIAIFVIVIYFQGPVLLVICCVALFVISDKRHFLSLALTFSLTLATKPEELFECLMTQGDGSLYHR